MTSYLWPGSRLGSVLQGNAVCRTAPRHLQEKEFTHHVLTGWANPHVAFCSVLCWRLYLPRGADNTSPMSDHAPSFIWDINPLRCRFRRNQMVKMNKTAFPSIPMDGIDPMMKNYTLLKACPHSSSKGGRRSKTPTSPPGPQRSNPACKNTPPLSFQLDVFNQTIRLGLVMLI